MADINWAADSGSTKTGSTSGNGVTSETGSIANCYDENDTSYYRRTSVVNGSGVATSTLTTRSVFLSPHTISRIRLRYSYYCGGYGTSHSYSWTLKYRVSGTWYNVNSGSGGGGGSPNLDIIYDSDNTGLSLSNVDAVEWNITTSGTGYRYDMFPFTVIPGLAGVQCNELYAYGPEDTGADNSIFFGTEL